MAPRKRNLHQQQHPFNDDYPFEAVLNGSWQPVELIKIEVGKTSIKFMDTEQFQSPLSSNIRVRSRQATAYDCSSFLRPGIDISMLLGYCYNDTPDRFGPIPMCMDARITSIQRQPHERDQCSCQFYVNLYDDQGSLGTELKTLDKEVNAIGISQVFILQRLQHNIGEGLLKKNDSSESEVKPYRWDSSEDCSSPSQTRLLIGKFLSDLSWFVTTSFLKKVSFRIRSAQNKIVYQVKGNDTDIVSHFLIDVVNFKLKDGTMVPVISQYDLLHDYHDEEHEASSVPSNLMEGLRRSKRRTVQSKRYVGFEVGRFRTWPYKRSSYVIDDENSSSDSEEDDVDELNLDPCSIQSTISNDVEVDDRVSLADYYSFSREKLKRMRFNGSEDDMDFESKWKGYI